MDVIRIRILDKNTNSYSHIDIIGVKPTIRDMHPGDVYLFPWNYKEACYVAKSSLRKEGMEIQAGIIAFENKKYVRVEKIK